MPARSEPAAQVRHLRHLRRQEGVATVWALAWIAVCLTMGWVGLVAAGAVAAQHHLDGSAELASLAGAAALQEGRDGCAVARQTAGDNGVHVVNCSLVAGDLVVAAEDTVPLPFGIDGTLSSAARAGPDAGS